MRPLRKGAARSGLRDGLSELLHQVEYGFTAGTSVSDEKLNRQAELQAAVLGGAIEATLADLNIKPAVFWRLTNENLWRLTRSLKASNLLDKVE